MWETVPPLPLRRAAAEPGKIAQVLPSAGTEAEGRSAARTRLPLVVPEE
jgi:hypothetical protein